MKKSMFSGILKKVLLTLGVLLLLAVAFYRFWFLRQPDRMVPNEPTAFISPANGVVAAVEVWDTAQLEWEKDNGVVQVMTQDIGEKGWLIAIEMNVMNVHYQRAPASGRFLKNLYTEGKFNNALIKTNRFGLRLENERNDLLFETENGTKYKVVQVAGLLARRIEDFLEPGQEVKPGEVIGVIKMGSQVGLIVPQNVQPLVKVGDTVIDGETILARVQQE
jgi:phosphatidylserine decarboxylase